MSQLELYAVLRSLGVEDDKAKAAVEDRADLVTKHDLELAIAQLKADLQKFMLQAMLGMTAIFAIIVGLFRVFT